MGDRQDRHLFEAVFIKADQDHGTRPVLHPFFLPGAVFRPPEKTVANDQARGRIGGSHRPRSLPAMCGEFVVKLRAFGAGLGGLDGSDVVVGKIFDPQNLPIPPLQATILVHRNQNHGVFPFVQDDNRLMFCSRPVPAEVVLKFLRGNFKNVTHIGPPDCRSTLEMGGACVNFSAAYRGRFTHSARSPPPPAPRSGSGRRGLRGCRAGGGPRRPR